MMQVVNNKYMCLTINDAFFSITHLSALIFALSYLLKFGNHKQLVYFFAFIIVWLSSLLIFYGFWGIKNVYENYNKFFMASSCSINVNEKVSFLAKYLSDDIFYKFYRDVDYEVTNKVLLSYYKLQFRYPFSAVHLKLSDYKKNGFDVSNIKALMLLCRYKNKYWLFLFLAWLSYSCLTCGVAYVIINFK